MLAERDRIRLLDMRDAAGRAIRFAASRDRAALDDKEGEFVYALERLVEIVGEAASKVGKDAQNEFPSVRWRDIVDMRNRLAHGYAAINPDILWATVVSDLPELLEQLDESAELL